MAPAVQVPSGLALLSGRRPALLQAYLDLVPLLSETLDPVTRQLIRIAVEVKAGSLQGLRRSVSHALVDGATCDQIIDAVALALPEAGLGRVTDALTVVAEFVEGTPEEGIGFPPKTAGSPGSASAGS